MTVESPDEIIAYATKIRKKLFEIDVNKIDPKFASYFPEDFSNSQKQAAIYVGAISGLHGPRYRQEVNSIAREMGLIEKGKRLKYLEMERLIRVGVGLRAAAGNMLVGESHQMDF